MEDSTKLRAISKVLSANDTGETGGHQAGILVPKDESILTIFPELDAKTKNPRSVLKFEDPSGEKWNFNFIYYNNKFFGGTRNEYRLTGMTAYFHRNNLKAGDKVIFHSLADNKRLIKFQRSMESDNATSSVLRLGTTWKVVNI